MDKRALEKIQTELSIKCGLAEATTGARLEAVNSIRNAVSFRACMEVSKMLIKSSKMLLEKRKDQTSIFKKMSSTNLFYYYLHY